MIWSLENIQQMQNVDLTTVDRDSLTDLNDIKIDTKKSVPQKLIEFASQTDNPFISRLDEYVVKVSYIDSDLTVNDKIKNYISRTIEIN